MSATRRFRPLLLPALFLSLAAHGQAGMRFIENKGQWPERVTHRAELRGATIWCERGALTIDLYDAEKRALAHANVHFDPVKDGTVQHHAVRLRFLNAAADVPVEASLQLTGHYNYFIGNDPSKWASNARPFARVAMRGVAPGCDAVFYEGRAGLKYDLVLAPGADPAKVLFTYEGAEGLALRNGALVVSTSLGRLTERIPLAYQEIDGDQRTVSCTYTLTKDGTVGIKPGSYDPSLPLVIDPTLVFATYSGSFSDNFGYTATFDGAGFLYAGSTAFGNRFPVTLGAYQTTHAGGDGLADGTDIALTKYDTTGSFLVWSTYLGGMGDEMPHSLIVDENDQLVVLGTTGSPDFPTTANAFDRTFGGGSPTSPIGLGISYPRGSDIIVARLSANGSTLLGSTYLGGTSNDGLNAAPALKFNYADEVRGEVLLAGNGEVWIVSCTQSTNMPVTPGAIQPAFAGGSHDGFIARFDPLLTQLLYASYFGGSGADAVYNGELDAQGRLYVCGGTTSTNLPVSASALGQTYFGGSADAFVARLSPTASAIEALSYWGSSAYDQAYFVELDTDGAVYLFGQTSAPSGQLILNAPFNLPNGGQFITKLDGDLSTLLLSSRFGSGRGIPDISPTAFLVDVCNKIYTSGWGSSRGGLGGQLSTAGLPITPNARQPATDGHDLYLAVFDIDMTAMYYGTFFGGPISPEHVDGGTSRFDRRGRVYQSACAGCVGNSDFPTTPTAWSRTNNSPNCNNGLVKFDFNAPLVIAQFLAPDTICGPRDVRFTNLSSGADTYLWRFGDGATSTATSPTHTYPGPGTWTVTLVAYNPFACNERDSTSRTITIHDPPPVLIAMGDTTICGPVDAFTLRARSGTAGTRFQWSSGPSFSDTLNATTADSTALITPAVGGTYYVRAWTTPICPAVDSVRVVVSNGGIELIGDSLICGRDTATLVVNGADPGSTIVWSPGSDILTGQGTPTVRVAPRETTGYGVTVTSPSGCTWTDNILVRVSPVDGPGVGVTVDQRIVTPGTTVQLNATPVTGVTHSWSPPDLVSDPTIPNPTARLTRTTTFVVRVSDGICTRFDSITVTVYELICEEPDIFVPNTFTPNGDGVNDVLYVRGRHITDLEFMVFDRWGEKVFETLDQSVGWDGTFRGEEVGPFVYVYHLTAWCLGGQRYFKKGNVTVVR